MAREMRDSDVEWLGMLPNNWGLDQIGSYFSLRSEKVSDEDYPPLSVTKQGVLPQLDHVAKSDDHANRKLVRAGDFAINSRSDRRNSCGFASQDGSVSLINTVCVPRRAMESRYFGHLFNTSQFADEFYAYGHGIVADLWTTGWKDMKKILLPMPPIDEQRSIADYLDAKCFEIDRAIEAAERSIEEYESYFEAVVTKLIWSTERTVKLGFIAVCLNGDRSSNYPSGDDIVQEGVAFLTSEELHGLRVSREPKKHITLQKYQSMRGVKLQLNDIVYCLRGSMGNCSLNDFYSEGTVASSLTVVRPKACDAEWLNYALHTLYAREHAVTTAIGATSGNLSAAWLAKMPLPAVDAAEQGRVVAILDGVGDSVYSVISAKQSIIDDLKAYKQSLVYEVVTGKREV